MIYYEHKNVQFAKKLRKEMTPWERKLWYCFLKSYPVRIQRQRAIDKFVADFYCSKAKLIIELDGGGHYDSQANNRDIERTRILESLGLKVIRFCNTDIDKKFYSVCTVIDKEIKNRILPQSACPADSPLSGGSEKV